VTQNTCTIVTRIKPNDLDALDELLTGIGKDLENNQYLHFAKIASLHMAALIIAAKDPRFPPTLIFESNFDGTADDFLRELVTNGRAGLDAIYSKCEGYPSGTALTEAAVLTYLRQHSLPTPAFFVGLPGQTVGSIRNAVAVREEINRFLDAEMAKNSIQRLSAIQVRDRIVAHLENDSPVKPEIPADTFASYGPIAQRNTFVFGLLALIAVVILSPLLIIWILAVRYLEVHEQKMPVRPDPPVDERTYAMEDLFIQNHLATLGVVKSNLLRRFTIRMALPVVGLSWRRILLRGGFGGIFTLHFAHVNWLDDGKRILLMTGYDGSALEYIGNFTDIAGMYINAAYGNVENFPACRWMLLGGAASLSGDAGWARQHMQYTPVFYSAYPNETLLNLMKDLDVRDHLASATSEAEVERLLKLL
jgi:hypothetical protein